MGAALSAVSAASVRLAGRCACHARPTRRRPSSRRATRCATRPSRSRWSVTLIEYRNGQADRQQHAHGVLEGRSAERPVPQPDPLRRAAARCQQADAQERQRPVVLRSRQPGEHPPLAAAAAARAGGQRRRADGEPGARLQGRAAGRGYTFQVLGSRLKPGCAEDGIVNAAANLLTDAIR